MLLKRTENEKMSMKMKKKNGWWTIKRRLMEFNICFQFIPIRVDKIHSDESGEYEWNESKRITMCWKEMIRKFKSHSDDSQSNQNERKVKWIREESHWTTIKSSRMNEITRENNHHDVTWTNIKWMREMISSKWNWIRLVFEISTHLHKLKKGSVFFEAY